VQETLGPAWLESLVPGCRTWPDHARGINLPVAALAPQSLAGGLGSGEYGRAPAMACWARVTLVPRRIMPMRSNQRRFEGSCLACWAIAPGASRSQTSAPPAPAAGGSPSQLLITAD